MRVQVQGSEGSQTQPIRDAAVLDGPEREEHLKGGQQHQQAVRASLLRVSDREWKDRRQHSCDERSPQAE